MKAYTNLEQSRKLAEIMLSKNADMWWRWCSDPFDEVNGGEYTIEPLLHKPVCNPEKTIPCWSLAALLETLPLEVEIHKQTDGHKIYYYVESYMKHMEKEIYLSTELYENSVDACYEMIMKLHKQNLLNL